MIVRFDWRRGEMIAESERTGYVIWRQPIPEDIREARAALDRAEVIGWIGRRCAGQARRQDRRRR